MSTINGVGLPPYAGPVQPALVEQRIAQLEAELAGLRAAAARREQLSLVTGMVAERYALDPEQAWDLLVRVSQNTNVKLREVARIVHDSSCGRLAPADLALADRLNRWGPRGHRQLVRLPQPRDGG